MNNKTSSKVQWAPTTGPDGRLFTGIPKSIADAAALKKGDYLEWSLSTTGALIATPRPISEGSPTHA